MYVCMYIYTHQGFIQALLLTSDFHEELSVLWPRAIIQCASTH